MKRQKHPSSDSEYSGKPAAFGTNVAPTKNAFPARLRSYGALLLSPDRRSDYFHEFRRRQLGEPALPPGPLQRILVICHGNICRSPFAHHVIASLRPDLEVRSAGLNAANGDPAQLSAVRVAHLFGLNLTNHRSTRLRAEHVEWADLTLGMEGHHVRQFALRFPKARSRIRLLGDFLDVAPHGIRDPYGAGDEVFHGVFSKLERAASAFAFRLADPKSQ